VLRGEALPLYSGCRLNLCNLYDQDPTRPRAKNGNFERNKGPASRSAIHLSLILTFLNAINIFGC